MKKEEKPHLFTHITDGESLNLKDIAEKMPSGSRIAAKDIMLLGGIGWCRIRDSKHRIALILQVDNPIGLYIPFVISLLDMVQIARKFLAVAAPSRDDKVLEALHGIEDALRNPPKPQDPPRPKLGF